ncbi:MAG: hypothetical protein Q8P67_04805, partial [archaeon]|nr:hypothetical protein [archaeon]
MFHEELTSESLLVTNQMQAGDCQVKTINPLLMRGRRSSVVMLQTESPTTPRGGKRKEEGQPKMNDSGQDVEAPRLWIDGSDRSFLDELLVREPIEDDSAESQSERQAPAQKKEEEKAVRSVERFVKAGTGRGLAMCMVELYWMDWHYVRCFLACFREFLSADQLLGVLAERFMRARAAGGLSEGWQLQVRSRVVEVLELWIAQYAASDLQDGSRGALGAAISFLRAAEALRIDKYAISARAGHLHALCVGMAISTTRLGAARPVLAHAQTLSMMAHVLIDRAQQQRQDEDKDKEVARESHDLGQISEWVENVLACGTQQALHWILALLDHGFLRVAASTPPPSPPSPSLSPSPQQKQSCGSKHRPPNQSGKRLLPISPSKSHKSKCGKSAAAGDINPYAQSALEDAEGEESMMAEHLAVPTRHPISNKHQIPCSSSSSSSSSTSNSPCSRS